MRGADCGAVVPLSPRNSEARCGAGCCAVSGARLTAGRRGSAPVPGRRAEPNWAAVEFVIRGVPSEAGLEGPKLCGGGRGCCWLTQGAGRFSPSSRSRPERTGRRWSSSSGVPSEAGAEGPKLAGAVRGCCWSHAGAGRFSPSSRSRPERTGRRWCSSLRCSFRGGRRGPKLAGAVRVLLVSQRGAGEVQPQFQVATGASWARWTSSLRCSFRGGPEARSWRGRCGVLLVHAGAGRFSPSSRWRPDRACARGGGPLLGGVLGEHGLDGLDDGLHERFPFGTTFLGPAEVGRFVRSRRCLRAQL